MTLIEEINKHPLECIKKIIRKVVYNLVEKQINKKVINKDDGIIETIYDLESIYNLQYNKYYYKIDNEDEYYEMSKDLYYIKLFRMIDDYDLNITIIDILQKLMIINTEIKNIPFINSIDNNILKYKNKELNCTYNLEFKKTFNEKKQKDFYKQISIEMSMDKYNTVIKEFTKYFEEKYPSFYKKHIYNKKSKTFKRNLKLSDFLNTMSIPVNNISLRFFVDYDTFEQFNTGDIIPEEEYENYIFVFFSFFTYIIKNCKSNLVLLNLGINYSIKKEKSITNYPHRNIIIFQNIKETNNKEKIIGFHYEPHGFKKGFSYKNFNIVDMFKTINTYSKLCTKYDSNFPEIIIHDKIAMCELGPQGISNKYDIGYCTVFSVFWCNCLLNTIETIKIIENKYNINSLSNIDITNWINTIDENLTTIKKNYIIKYSNKKYNIEYLFKVKKYLFQEHYDKYKLKNIFSTLDLYISDINKVFKTVNNKLTLTITDFLDIYYDKYLVNLINNSVTEQKKNIKIILDSKYKMGTLDYYNIFVNYIYNLIELILSSKYFKEQKDLLNKYSQNDIFKKIIESNKLYNKVNISNFNDKEYLNIYKKEKQEYDNNIMNYKKDDNKLYNNKQYIISQEHENEINNIVDKLTDIEKNNIGDICSKNEDCEGSLICDSLNQCNINYNKKTIGNICNFNSDCYSDYCSIDKICRKSIHYC